MNPLSQSSRVRELMAIGRMQRRRSVRHAASLGAGPLREIDDVGAPLWPAESGGEYLERLSCGHYRKCTPRCSAQAHRCALCLKSKGV